MPGKLISFISALSVLGSALVTPEPGQPQAPFDGEASLLLLSSLELEGTIYDVAVAEGTIAYVAAGTAGVVVLDMSNPAEPTKVGGFDTQGEARGLAPSGPYLFVADCYSGLVALDVSDPSNPGQIGSLAPNPDHCLSDIQVSESRAYALEEAADFLIVDVSDPALPSLISRIVPSTGGERALDVEGSIAYIIFRNMLWIYDVSSPEEPSDLGQFGMGVGYDLEVVSNVAYLSTDDGFIALDVSDPRAPSLIWAATYEAAGVPFQFEVAVPYAFLGGRVGTTPTVRVLSASPESAPPLLASYEFPPETYQIASVWAIDGDLVFASLAGAQDRRLHVLRFLANDEPTCIPSDPRWSDQWNMEAIHAGGSWTFFPNCLPPSVKLAVVDTGVFESHPELEGRIGLATSLAGSNVSDLNGHGTAISGIIAANRDNAEGLAGIHPLAELYVYKIMVDPKSENSVSVISRMAESITRAVDSGAQVITISTQTSRDWCIEGHVRHFCTSGGVLESAVRYASDSGRIIVVGANEEGKPIWDLPFPAAYSLTYANVIAVSASAWNNTPAEYSLPGDYITISAPGGDATRPLILLGASKDFPYVSGQGTSFAAPHVAGVVALVLAANPDLAPAEVRGLIVDTATPFAPDGGAHPGYFGAGIVNAEAAVEEAIRRRATP